MTHKSPFFIDREPIGDFPIEQTPARKPTDPKPNSKDLPYLKQAKNLVRRHQGEGSP
jgi:hypothetical protein